ncbi:hypothetical protein P7V44_07575 [Providencia sp. CRE-3FA-0001]|uniref:Uncharacterized protein n=2 Tax=Enterobacterales TaxID=91347 RepID=A0AA42FGB4_9GAMM|nr:hypothetical protein [Providencia sp. CRE-3FA-0001]ELR5243188.1 hypothetical protein [Providencia rettgeri]ELR5280534.1 hypothetical protein [Providencia rettgeri]MDG4696099.1 hypothetical protein [Providencia sp. CRE-3FA-0001]UCK65563.1 hypothetical protein [Providencia rettgeri]URR25444.1 hypothetical protein L3Q80_24105 [Providencia rettgeri]
MRISLKGIIKTLKAFFSVCFILFLMFGFITTMERLVWVNADSYPTFLAKDLDSPALSDPNSIASSIEYFENVCGEDRGLMSFITKNNGLFLRCDDTVGLTSWFNGVYKLNYTEKLSHKIGNEHD